MLRPSPVPSPTGLVVKKGSNIRLIVSGAMPWPVSATLSRTYSPGAIRKPISAKRGSSRSLGAIRSTEMVTWSPVSLASRALATRLIRTRSTCAGSAMIRGSGASGSASSSSLSAPSSCCRTGLEIDDELGQVQRPRLGDLLPGEGKQLLRHPRGAFRRLQHQPHVGDLRVLRAEAAEDERAEAQGRLERVVHLVRHAAGKGCRPPAAVARGGAAPRCAAPR